MNIIKQNPFRILGLTGNATEKELQKQLSKIKAYTRVGKEIKLDYDLPFLGELKRDNETIQGASSKIEQADKKLIYSLFWFISNSKFDNIALNYIKDNQIDKAIEIWDKTLKDEITTQNCSSYQNISSLYIALSIKDNQIDFENLKAGVSLKGKILNSDNLINFSKIITGNEIVKDQIIISKKFVDEVIELVKPYKILASDLISLFNNYPTEIKKYVTSKFTEVPIVNIENKIDKTIQKRKNNPQSAYDYGEELYKSINSDLLLLKNLLGIRNIQYQILADKIANEIMQCSIDFFNKKQEIDNDDYFEEYLNNAIKLVKLAKSIAISEQVSNRADENINTLNGMKDRVIIQAIALLQSVKDAYETNKAQIMAEVKKQEMFLGFGESINWSKVNEIIDNSINWGEVNRLLRKVLDDKKLKKIKESDNAEIKTKFLGLVNWLKGHSLENFEIIRIIDTYKKIPPKLPFIILSSEITNTNDKPLYTKFVRYIGLKLNIEVVEEAAITFFLKYITPDGHINRYSEISPEGYTLSETCKLHKNIKTITIPGWGKPDECIYYIGKHRIEVYVDEYLIYSKDFVVDLSPSEKLEKEIQNAEKKLSEIISKQYYNSELHNLNNKINILLRKLSRIQNKLYYGLELQNLNNQMTRVKEWKLFRNKNTKYKQIYELQQKINTIILKGEKEKKLDILRIEEEIAIKRNKLKQIKEKAEAKKIQEISKIQTQLAIKKRELNELNK